MNTSVNTLLISIVLAALVSTGLSYSIGYPTDNQRRYIMGSDTPLLDMLTRLNTARGNRVPIRHDYATLISDNESNESNDDMPVVVPVRVTKADSKESLTGADSFRNCFYSPIQCRYSGRK